MGLVALEEIVMGQQDQATAAVCRSQTASITHLEPGAQTDSRGGGGAAGLNSATGCKGQRSLPAQTDRPGVCDVSLLQVPPCR